MMDGMTASTAAAAAATEARRVFAERAIRLERDLNDDVRRACAQHGNQASLLLGAVELNCAEHDIVTSLAFQVLTATAFTLLIMASLIGNLVVMWIIYKHKVMHHAFNYFLFNMALADLLIAVINVGTSWTFNLYYDWWYGDFCAVNLFFGVAPTCVSVFSMMALSWDRYQAVVNPLRRRPLSDRCSAVSISLIWICSSLIALPVAIYSKVEKSLFYAADVDTVTVKRSCQYYLPDALSIPPLPGNLYDHGLFVLQYALPLLTLGFTFGRIAYALRRSEHVIIRTNTHKMDPIKAKQKVVKMLAVMVCVFMVCWFPYHVYHAFEFFDDFEMSSKVYIAVYWLAMSTCACNPFIYCFTNKRFRVGFRFAFRRLPFVEFDRREYECSALFSKTGAGAARSFLAYTPRQDTLRTPAGARLSTYSAPRTRAQSPTLAVPPSFLGTGCGMGSGHGGAGERVVIFPDLSPSRSNSSSFLGGGHLLSPSPSIHLPQIHIDGASRENLNIL